MTKIPHKLKTLGIMQPYFFPYIGYFQLINCVDTFIIYDDVHFIKKGWINRNNILQNGNPSLFTIPLVGASQNKLINEIDIDSLEAWSTKFLKTIEQSYKKAPYFSIIFEMIRQIVTGDSIKISTLATKSIQETCQYLGISTKIIEHSSIYNNSDLKAQFRILDICKQEQAEHYINPIGGISIYDKQLFEENKILLNFIRSKPIVYQQFKGDFVPWLSMIDILMFCNPEEIHQHLNKFELV